MRQPLTLHPPEVWGHSSAQRWHHSWLCAQVRGHSWLCSGVTPFGVQESHPALCPGITARGTQGTLMWFWGVNPGLAACKPLSSSTPTVFVIKPVPLIPLRGTYVCVLVTSGVQSWDPQMPGPQVYSLPGTCMALALPAGGTLPPPTARASATSASCSGSW